MNQSFERNFAAQMEAAKAEITREIRQRIEEMLDRNADIIEIQVEKRQELIRREVEYYLAKHQRERINGLLNDESCEEFGITVYLDRTKFEIDGGGTHSILRRLRGASVPQTKLGDKLIRLDFSNENYFTLENGNIEINRDLKKGTFQIELAPDQIVRIEANCGNLWQNSKHDWESLDKSELPPEES